MSEDERCDGWLGYWVVWVGLASARRHQSLSLSVVKIRRRKRTLSRTGVDAPLQPMTDKATSLEIYQRLRMGSFPFTFASSTKSLSEVVSYNM